LLIAVIVGAVIAIWFSLRRSRSDLNLASSNPPVSLPEAAARPKKPNTFQKEIVSFPVKETTQK
jgi:hypothetical protein